HQFGELLPWKTNLGVVLFGDFTAKNVRASLVDLRQGNSRLPLVDPPGKFGDLEAHFGMKIMRPRREQLGGEAMEKVAEFEDQFIRAACLRRGDGWHRLQLRGEGQWRRLSRSGRG